MKSYRGLCEHCGEFISPAAYGEDLWIDDSLSVTCEDGKEHIPNWNTMVENKQPEVLCQICGNQMLLNFLGYGYCIVCGYWND